MSNNTKMKMSTRNLIWLIAIVATGVLVTLSQGWKLGLAAAAIVLLVSEVIERQARSKRPSPQPQL